MTSLSGNGKYNCLFNFYYRFSIYFTGNFLICTLNITIQVSSNKEEIKNLLDAKTYNDPNCLLPPNEEDIKAISNFQA